MRKRKVVNLERPKILVSRPDRLGDVLLSTPIFHSLKDRFPDSKIVMICYPAAASLMKDNPYIDEIWLIECPWWEKNRGINAYIHFFKKCRSIYKKTLKEKFDVFIELRGDIRLSFLFGWLPDIPMRISNDRSNGTFLLTHHTKFNFSLHEIEKNYQLLAFFEPIHKYLKTEVYTDSNTTFFKEHSISNRFIVIFNGGRSPLRRLTEAKITDLVTKLNDRFKIQCVMIGDAADGQQADLVQANVNRPNAFLNVCGKLSLSQIKILIEHAALFIGTDSSINHVAAATNTPSISLYGPMIPSQVEQLGRNKLYIFHEYPCAPCLQKRCEVTNSFVEAQCMKDITVQEILVLADRLLVDESYCLRKKPA